jgi:hypothetical protein
MIIIIVKREFDCLENEITVEDDNDEQDENFLPKNKRMKLEEEGK